MVQQLTTSERQNALVILLLVFVAGVTMAALGKSDPLGVHGLMVLLFGGGLAALLCGLITSLSQTRTASPTITTIQSRLALS
jgi:hypothetical protein